MEQKKVYVVVAYSKEENFFHIYTKQSSVIETMRKFRDEQRKRPSLEGCQVVLLEKSRALEYKKQFAEIQKKLEARIEKKYEHYNKEFEKMYMAMPNPYMYVKNTMPSAMANHKVL